MASEHSFDVSASVDMMEVKNAVETAKRELSTRYDFKGLTAEITLNEKYKTITLLSTSDNKIEAIKDILLSKVIKRGIEPSALKDEKKESASGSNVREILKINDSMSMDDSKKIIKAIKDSKIKVNAQIRGDEIRVTSKSIDDLQECIRLIRSLDLEIPLSFKNLK